MATNCGLRIFTACIGSSNIEATQNGMFNNRPQYIFSFVSVENDIISGRIYWDSDDNVWYVEDTDNNLIISVLPFDRVHPYGTAEEWQNNTLLTYGCLSNSNLFYTTWSNQCPPSYFEFCCSKSNPSTDFFGVQSFEYYGYVDSVFYLESPQFSGCATVIEGPIPNDSVVYNSVDNITTYDTCSNCTGNTLSCYLQPVYAITPPIPPLTADTGCGVNYVLVNECEPITIKPLFVGCEVTNVTTIGGNDGFIELIITGGTPPYEIQWKNGESTQFITNLVTGKYDVTVTDYYGDFVLSNSCYVSGPIQITPTPTPTAIPLYDNFCMTITVDRFSSEPYSIYFEQNGYANGKPMWTDSLNQYSILWDNNRSQPFWFLQGLDETYQINITNTNPQTPPTNQWFVQGAQGNVVISYDECFEDIICATISSLCETENIELTRGEYINEQPAWYGVLPCQTVGDSWFIFYDNVNNVWSTSGLTNVPEATNESIINNNNYIGPFGNFDNLGYYGLFVSNGLCNSQGSLKMAITVNEPISNSDGNIIIELEGGNQPYQYSVDNGTTYQPFPIFENLKSGIYVVTAKDANGLTIKKSVTLKTPPPKVDYRLSLNTTSKRTVNTPTNNVLVYTTIVSTYPALPSGVTVNFDIVHTNTFRKSPSEDSSSLILSSILTKNGEEIGVYSIENSTYTETNSLLSCQNNLIYFTSTTENWNSISISYEDEVKITTVVDITKNGKYSCYIAENNEEYSLFNTSIVGCDNCSLTNQYKLPPATPPAPTPSTPPSSTPVVTPTLSINTFNLGYDPASFTIICFGSAPTSNYYSYDSTINVGTILYTDSVYPLSSFAPAGYYGNASNYYQITGTNGEVISSNSCI